MKAIVSIVILSFFSSIAIADKSYVPIEKDPLLNTIWKGFVRLYDENSSNKYYSVSGKVFKKGTVLPKAMRSVVNGRLPAYIACYDFVEYNSFVGAENKSNICVYFLQNPERGVFTAMWRGKISDFSHSMSQDGFVENGK